MTPRRGGVALSRIREAERDLAGGPWIEREQRAQLRRAILEASGLFVDVGELLARFDHRGRQFNGAFECGDGFLALTSLLKHRPIR